MQAVDWLRGLAVLFMIQCHAMVLLLPELRKTRLAGTLYRLDGLVAPSFILAAGFSLGLVLVRAAMQGKLRDRVEKTGKRLVEVWIVAFTYTIVFLGGLHRLDVWLRVEILHCIALSLCICLALAAVLASRPLLLSLAAPGLGALVFAVSPFAEGVRGFWSHFANSTTESMFPLFPWLGYALLGLGLGSETARGGVRGLARACVVVFGVGMALHLFRAQVVAAYPPHDPWVTSPAEAGVRLAKVMGVTLVLMALERKLPAAEKQPPLRLMAFFGTSSLGGYFFHELLLYEPVFGIVSFVRFFRDSSGWTLYWVLTAALIALTAVVVIGWEKLWGWVTAEASRRWAALRGTAPRRSPSSG